MASSDWPDYTHGVVLSDGSVTDCPDWQEQVVGPGGVPISGGGITVLGSLGGTGVPVPISGSGSVTTTSVACSNAAAGYAMASWLVVFDWACSSLDGYIGGNLSGDYASVGANLSCNLVDQILPNEVASSTQSYLQSCGLIYLTNAAAVINVSLFWGDLNSGSTYELGGGGFATFMVWAP